MQLDWNCDLQMISRNFYFSTRWPVGFVIIITFHLDLIKNSTTDF